MRGSTELCDYTWAPSNKAQCYRKEGNWQVHVPKLNLKLAPLSIQLLSPFSESRKIPFLHLQLSLVRTDVSHGKPREVSPIK